MSEEDPLLKYLMIRFDNLEAKVDDLREFKWKGVGAGIVLSAISGGFFGLLCAFIAR